jgi:hypothetical protein
MEAVLIPKEDNMKKNKLFLMSALAAILLFAGCDAFGTVNSVAEPELEWQSRDIEFGAGRTVTVEYLALPGVTPTWWSKLTDVFTSLASTFVNNSHVTLTVIPGSADGFSIVRPGSMTGSIGEVFLSSSDYTAIRNSIGPKIAAWLATEE